MPTVYDLTREQLTNRLVAWGEPAFRAKQVLSQLWRRAATYDQMSDIPPALREQLAANLPLGVEVLDERTADRGATRKALLRLGGEHAIETVLMGYRDRVTVCVSSQSGCAMGCTFCATGQMGLKNNLTAGEIGAQAVWARREAARLPASTPQRLTNIVFMGMGEPLSGCLLPGQQGSEHDVGPAADDLGGRDTVLRPGAHGCGTVSSGEGFERGDPADPLRDDRRRHPYRIPGDRVGFDRSHLRPVRLLEHRGVVGPSTVRIVRAGARIARPGPPVRPSRQRHVGPVMVGILHHD